MKILKKKTVLTLGQRMVARQGLLLVLVAALTLEATSLLQFYFARKGLEEEATRRAQGELELTGLRITSVLDQVEAAVRNNVWSVRETLARPDSLWMVPNRIVRDNPVIIGSAVALVPGYSRRRPSFAPYVCRENDTLQLKTLATEAYDYASQPWFTEPLELGRGFWSEPYFDTGGGEVLMTTFSLPVTDKKGRVACVLTADLSLDWLTEMVGNVKVYPRAYSMMLSRLGQIMVCPAESLVMRKSVSEVTTGLEDSVTIQSIAQSMIAGEHGKRTVLQGGEKNYVFFAPVERAGWSMSIVIPYDEIYGNIKRLGLMVLILQLIGLLMLILIIRSTALGQARLQALSERKEKIERELQVARDIQMSMLPKTFPPYPDRNDLDMFGTIVPAKEVGGDLYDFFIRDERLFFCVGDVSGKGVPASLVMAMTRSLFRTVSAHEISPQRIVTAMNDLMSDTNENNMFVTLFVGVLDLPSGHLRYCNAGHDAPLLISGEGVRALPVKANIALGVASGMIYHEQDDEIEAGESIFLYTDGLTEAEDEKHRLYGDKRFLQVCQGTAELSAHDILWKVREDVAKHVGKAAQSDDLTMLVIKYMNTNQSIRAERHLVLHNDIQQIPQLADFIGRITAESGIDQSLSLSLNLALEEAVTNVILYAYPEGADGLVDIEAIIRDTQLDFIVSDSGKPFDPTQVQEADVTLGVDDRPIGGLGVFLVRSIMDSVSYERKDGKNVLYMTKKL